MNKDQKRFRQTNIFQSFANCKKPKTTVMGTTEQKRELMASAAEIRHQASKMESVPENKLNSASLKSNLKELLLVTNNNDSTVLKDETTEKGSCNEYNQLGSSFQISQCELLEGFTSSQELFPDSGEIFQSSEELFPDIEEYPSQQSTSSLNPQHLSLSEQSQEIFSVSQSAEIRSTEIDAVQSDVDDEAVMYIKKKPDCSIPLPKLEPLENHTIMFFPHIRPGDAPRPFPSFYKDFWDCDHIRMPCSLQNRFPVEDSNGEKQIISRWDLICQSLRRPIRTSSELEDAIMSYNSQYRGRWNFRSFHTFFSNCFSEEELSRFFQTLLPAMINMALNLPKICTQPLPLLKKNKDHYVTLSQKQAGCLLLNAFFCTFPRRNFMSQNNTSEYATYPDINFNRLYFGVKNKVLLKNLEKLKCLINYFRRITSQEPSGTITFHRQSLTEIPEWSDSTRGLSTVVIKSDGLIENDGHGMLQVDFANKFVGGGVLGQGCVQEEIRFIICPELIVSRLFVECLGPNEVLLITGVEQYSKYSGYGDTFKWEGNFKDHTQRDAWGRRLTEVVAMDATPFRNTLDQYHPVYIRKELTKAFCGFYEDAPPGNLCAVATGNWGCGAYKGNATFKFLIQLLACSEAKRGIVYFTFGNKVLKKKLSSIHSLLIDKNLTVGDLWRILLSYSCSVKLIRNEPYPNLYDHLMSTFAPEKTDDTEMPSTCERLILAVENDSDTEENNNTNLLNEHD